MINFDMPKEKSSIIKVIGVGGGGSNAVNHMYKQGIEGVDFIVVNTDAQNLYQSPVPNKIQIGTSLTEGRGAGSIPEKGKEAALESVEEIREALNNTKMVFITAGMGGGTGTGAAPVIASIARELGILTVGIVTIPFAFEGRKRKMQAEKGIEEIKNNVDAMLIICNDKLRELFGNLKLSEAFAKADDILTSASKGIAEIITVAGYINVDFEDVNTVMRNSGVAIMGTGRAEGENRANKAVEEALASPLLNDNNIKGAKNILLYISSGDEEISMDEVTEVTEYIQYEAGSDADVIWGNGTDASLGDSISVTLVVTGFDVNEDLEIGKEKTTEKVVNELETEDKEEQIEENREDDFMVIKKPVSSEETKEEDKPKKIYSLNDESEEVSPRIFDDNPIEFSAERNPYSQAEKETPSEQIFQSSEDAKEKLEKEEETFFDIENKSQGIETEKFKERKKKLQELSLSLNTDTKIAQNAEDIVEMESVPAYERKGIELNDVTPASESEISRLSLGEEKDEEGNTHINMNSSNSFIHDNVD
jgi:cell division protein FtsZ